MDIFGRCSTAPRYPINIKEDSLEDIVQWCREEALTIYHSTPRSIALWSTLCRRDQRYQRCA